MTFERVTIEEVPVLSVSEHGAPPVAGPRAFERLEATLPSLRGRKFYGVFDPITGEYRACVATEEGDDPAVPGRSSAVIPGGTYLRARLRGPLAETTARISETLAAMATAATPDPGRRAVEFYRRSDELVVLFPVLD